MGWIKPFQVICLFGICEQDLVFINTARNGQLGLHWATVLTTGFVTIIARLIATSMGVIVSSLSISAGQRVRKGKRTKKPMPRWVRKILVFCGVMIKLSVVLIVLYFCWLVYVLIYEEFFLTYQLVKEPYLLS